MKGIITNSSTRHLVMVAVLMPMLPGSALAAGVANTRHDLSDSTDTTTETCIFCHTPHKAITNADIPLWNQELSTVSSYGTYSSSTMDGSPTDLGGATESSATISNLCLSCHDGTVAIGSRVDPSLDSTMPDIIAANLGTDMTAEHPINFSYDTSASTDDGLAAVTEVEAAGLELFGPDNQVQCASCHNPHDDTNGYFLRQSMDSSGLCNTCHNDK